MFSKFRLGSTEKESFRAEHSKLFLRRGRGSFSHDIRIRNGRMRENIPGTTRGGFGYKRKKKGGAQARDRGEPFSPRFPLFQGAGDLLICRPSFSPPFDCENNPSRPRSGFWDSWFLLPKRANSQLGPWRDFENVSYRSRSLCLLLLKTAGPDGDFPDDFPAGGKVPGLVSIRNFSGFNDFLLHRLVRICGLFACLAFEHEVFLFW